MKKLTTASLFAAVLVAFGISHAQVTAPTSTTTTTKKVRKSTTTITTVDEDGDSNSIPTTTTSTSEVQEGEIITTFGSRATSGTTGCKTEELSRAVIRDLKAECQTWVKEQRSDLKAKFHTSTCEDQCVDCGTSLLRCTVVGMVKYRKN